MSVQNVGTTVISYGTQLIANGSQYVAEKAIEHVMEKLGGQKKCAYSAITSLFCLAAGGAGYAAFPLVTQINISIGANCIAGGLVSVVASVAGTCFCCNMPYKEFAATYDTFNLSFGFLSSRLRDSRTLSSSFWLLVRSPNMTSEP